MIFISFNFYFAIVESRVSERLIPLILTGDRKTFSSPIILPKTRSPF
ncbi:MULTISPECIES: hypothetical protein [Spirulina sp. CCY15215]|nr:hypothetical protein [Spirulina major]